MEVTLIVLLGLSAVILPILLLVLTSKKRPNMSGPPIDLLVPKRRYRDGAITYTQNRWGVRSNVKVEIPNAPHNARYERRHSIEQHKEKKPWMK